MSDSELPPSIRDFSEADARDAVVTSETERKYLIDKENERYWWFDITTVSWYRKNQIFGDCLTGTQSGESRLDVARYNREMMVEMTESWSGEDQMGLTEFLTGIEDSLGNQIEEWVPAPAGSPLDEDEEGNSDEQSGSEAPTTPR